MSILIVYSLPPIKGAYISFRRDKPSSEPYFVVGGAAIDTDDADALFYTVHDYSCTEVGDSLEKRNKSSLRSLILKKRQALLEEFASVDSTHAGLVSTSQWEAIMERVTGVMINWESILHLLEIEFDGDGFINYKQFVEKLRSDASILSGTDDSGLFLISR